MKRFSQITSSALLLIGLSLGTTTVHAQNRIAGAVQQGNGAYVQKTDRTTCITSQLLGVSGLGSCLDMRQDKFMVTPSGNAMSVWTGTLPASVAHPAQRLTYNSTWTETNNDGVTRTYDTVAVTDPNGSVKLTLTDKQNGNGKNNGRTRK
ncbi:hypothetical protein GCM10023172_39280 [Hymenobacter ginsengisoli]|uniref:Lipocalin-like domain-containing protein n=1 Tax=Hymenobacter ginsengisoli TaxID=1051626 RepID=A0ABP8QRP5_9BACT|nr:MULTISPECIES: hypothetical protein [unclassified Hymenobacter]MBO2032938.1 hypothetical protein [Hymenobacter sp. BT559]